MGRRFQRSIIGIINDWIEDNIRTIFAQFVLVSMYGAFNAIGCAEAFIYAQMKWSKATEVMNWVWLIDAVLTIYCALVYGKRRIQ